MANVKSWYRLPNESSAAYAAFKVYLDSADRSLQNVAEMLQKSRQTITRWAKKFAWQERSAAYDSSIVEGERKRKAKRWNDAIEKLWKEANLYADRAIEKMLKLDVDKMSVRATIDMGLAAKDIINAIAELEASKGDADKVTAITIKRFEG